MHDLTPFEQRLSERLGRELSASLRPFDPAEVAATAVGRRTFGERLRNWLGVGPLPPAPAWRRAAVVAVAALLALATIALVAGLASRGNSLIAYVRSNGEVVVAQPDGSAQAVVYRVASPVLFTRIEVAPGGLHLAVVDEDIVLTIVDRRGEVTHRRKLDDGRSPLAWSPDGQRLAISDGPWLSSEGATLPLTDPRLEIVRPDGTVEWEVPLPEEFRYVSEYAEVAWSADGRTIALTGSTDAGTSNRVPSTIWLVDTVDRRVRDLTGGDATTFDFQPRWLPDGRLLFSRDNSGVIAVDVSTGDETVVFEIDPDTCADDACVVAAVHLYELSPDGRGLAVLHPVEGIAVLDLLSGTLTPVDMPVNGLYGPTPVKWTRDAQALLVQFSATRDGSPFQVFAVNVRTGRQQVLVTDAGFFDVAY